MTYHIHQPDSERDSDGMYEPICVGCNLFTEPAIANVMRRWPTSLEAQAAATAVIDMLPIIREGKGQ
jgi:hypothetical protein